MNEVIELVPQCDLSEGAVNLAVDALSMASNSRIHESNTVLSVSIWDVKEAVKIAAWVGCQLNIVKHHREDEWSLRDILTENTVHCDGA